MTKEQQALWVAVQEAARQYRHAVAANVAEYQILEAWAKMVDARNRYEQTKEQPEMSDLLEEWAIDTLDRVRERDAWPVSDEYERFLIEREMLQRIHRWFDERTTLILCPPEVLAAVAVVLMEANEQLDLHDPVTGEPQFYEPRADEALRGDRYLYLVPKIQACEIAFESFDRTRNGNLAHYGEFLHVVAAPVHLAEFRPTLFGLGGGFV